MKRLVVFLLAGAALLSISASAFAQNPVSAAANDRGSAAQGSDTALSQDTAVAVPSAAFEGTSNYRISLLTCGPGSELYSTFGHSALRVMNMATGSDDVYNFGMFDFSDPDFYIEFVKGNLDYYLGVQDFDRFVAEYEAENRYVYEQTLTLTTIQTERILSELDFRYLPENRAYKYEFIQRNCTTELRDIIAAAIEPDDFLWTEDSGTWRRYLNACLTDKAWAKIGINIILGSRVDVPINNFEKMCLPELLSENMDRMKAGGGLESDNQMLAPDNGAEERIGFIAKNYPYIILIIIVLAVILIGSRTLDFVYCLLLGVVGLLIIFLMFYGTHMEFKANYNLLLLNPLLIWLGVALLRSRRRSRAGGGSYSYYGQSYNGHGGRNRRRRSVVIPAALCLTSLLCLIAVWIIGIQGFEAGMPILAVPALWVSVKGLVAR